MFPTDEKFQRNKKRYFNILEKNKDVWHGDCNLGTALLMGRTFLGFEKAKEWVFDFCIEHGQFSSKD